MIGFLRKTIARSLGLLLVLISVGLLRPNWSGSNAEMDDELHFGSDISEFYEK